jgi:exodeoxyribonuclease III
MKLISWNVARKVVRCEEQVLALQDFHPDILAFQEVLPKSAAKLRRLLPEMSLNNVLDTTLTAVRRPWSYGVLIASRWAIEATAQQLAIPYPERSLSVQVSSPKCTIELYTVHIPTGSRDGSIRIDTMKAIYNQLSEPSTLPRILCGDFNAPKAEGPNGELITWEQIIYKNGMVKIQRGRDRWDQVERSLIAGLTSHDFVDVFRYINGYGTRDASWRQTWRPVPGYRLDHIFASQVLKPIGCRYLHQLREAGLSDHSPMEAELLASEEPRLNAGLVAPEHPHVAASAMCQAALRRKTV